MVQTAGVERATGGKPAQLYEITPEAEEMFPKAYALVLSSLIQLLEERYKMVESHLGDNNDTLAFSGKLRGRKLAPGIYRATAVATNSGGASKPVVISFAKVTGRAPATSSWRGS